MTGVSASMKRTGRLMISPAVGAPRLLWESCSSSSSIVVRGVLPRDHGRGRLGVTSAVDGAEQRADVHRAGAGAGGDEHPVLHADRLQQHLGVDEFHELVGDDAETVHVAGHVEGDGVDVEAPHPLHPHHVDHPHEHLPLVLGQSAVQVALDEGLRSAQPHGGGQHLGVADGGARDR